MRGDVSSVRSSSKTKIPVAQIPTTIVVSNSGSSKLLSKKGKNSKLISPASETGRAN